MEDAGLKSQSNVDNYLRIAYAKHLRKPEFEPYRPVGFGSLIDLANAKVWTEENLKAAINAEVLHRGSTRAQLKTFIKERSPAEESPSQPSMRDETHLYEAGYLLYFHQALTSADRKSVKEYLKKWRPAASSLPAEPDMPYVVLRKTEPRQLKNDVYDRFSDQHGDVVRKDGRWMSPTQVRSTDEIVYAEPWDKSWGVRPGDKV